jgi:hypothetical protein
LIINSLLCFFLFENKLERALQIGNVVCRTYWKNSVLKRRRFMALMICPECGNEVSDQAFACPKCGRPFEAPTVVTTPPPVITTPPPVVREPVIVAEPPRHKSFPNWIFLPIIVVLAVVTLFMFLMLSDDNANDNANGTQVNVRLRENETARTRTVSNAEAQTGTAETATTTAPSTIQTAPPPQISDSTVSSIPQSSYPTTGTTSTTTTAPPDKGNLEIKATVATRSGSTQAVKQEKFYLLDKSLDEILSRAKIEPEEGDLPSTCAAAVIDPARRETREKCLAAIKPHIVYSVTTDSTGKGAFKNVKPDSYYVFGVTKVGTDSYAIWNTTVTVNPGDNLLNLNGSGSPLSPVGLNSNPNY